MDRRLLGVTFIAILFELIDSRTRSEMCIEPHRHRRPWKS